MRVIEEDNFEKEVVTKSDGRYLIYYNFSVEQDEAGENKEQQHGLKRRK